MSAALQTGNVVACAPRPYRKCRVSASWALGLYGQAKKNRVTRELDAGRPRLCPGAFSATGESLWTRGTVMKKALLCATAAATMVSAGATAYAQDGWYGTGKIGAVVDGLQDVDAAGGANGRI